MNFFRFPIDTSFYIVGFALRTEMGDPPFVSIINKVSNDIIVIAYLL